MVDVLDTGKWTPHQALLVAEKDLDEMTDCVILYMKKGEEVPRVTTSAMDAVSLHFFGFALQTYACNAMKEA